MRASILVLWVFMVTCGYSIADDVSIHRMLSEGRIIELAETRQITSGLDGKVSNAWISPDGNYVGYVEYRSGQSQVCILKSSGGGRPVVIMSESAEPDEAEYWDLIGWRSGIAWSPDSKLVAFAMRHSVPDGSSYAVELGILVFTSRGSRRAYFPLSSGQDMGMVGSLYWSPDSGKFACTYTYRSSNPGEEPRWKTDLLILNLEHASSKTVFSQEGGRLDFDVWTKGGNAVRYVTSDKNGAQLRESLLDEESSYVVMEHYAERMRSPDRSVQLADGRSGISIENCSTGEIVEVFKSMPGEFLGWCPDNRTFMFQRPEFISDATGKRERLLNTLWLAVPEAHSLNHMCVALDCERHQAPTWSDDCLKTAYVSEGRIYVAELAWTEVSTDDKLAAGLPLTEEEEKVVLTNNIKQIGIALGAYASDWDGKLPAGDTFAQDLVPYLRGGEKLFLRPGTQEFAFQYIPQLSMQAIERPAETMVGMFDVGYGWQIVLYADGHVNWAQK